jgi:MFS family permease
MIKIILQNYFTNKDYSYLYLHNAFKSVSFFTMGIFIGGWLYKIGLDLHWIVLYQMAHFTFMGLLSPLGAYLTNRFGMVITLGLSFFGYVSSLFCLGFAEESYFFVFLGLAFGSFANGLQNPTDIILHAAYIQNQNRGRALSVVNIITTFITFLSVLLSGWVVENIGLWGLALICTFFYGLSLFCLGKINDILKGSEEKNHKDLYAEVFHKDNRNYLGIALGFQFLIIGSFVFVPVILYLNTENFQSISIIAAIAVLIQSLVILLQGIWVDKSKTNAPLRFAISTHAFGLIIYSLPFVTKWGLFVGDAFQRTGLMLFFGSLFPRIHNHIVKEKMPLLSFGARFHMAICFWEFITLSIMAWFIYLFGKSALSYCLVVCALGGFLSYIYCHKMMEEKSTQASA